MINPIRDIDRRRYHHTSPENNARPRFERWLNRDVSNDGDNRVPENLAVPSPFRLSISAENLLLLSQEMMETVEMLPYREEERDIDENQYEFSFLNEMEHFSANI